MGDQIRFIGDSHAGVEAVAVGKIFGNDIYRLAGAQIKRPELWRLALGVGRREQLLAVHRHR